MGRIYYWSHKSILSVIGDLNLTTFLSYSLNIYANLCIIIYLDVHSSKWSTFYNLLNPAFHLGIVHQPEPCGYHPAAVGGCQDLTSVDRWDWEELEDDVEDDVAHVARAVQQLDLILADARAARDGMAGRDFWRLPGLVN